MNELSISRLACVVFSLFPALWGVFGFMNNTANFTETAKNAVEPLLSMRDTYNIPGQAWRAINSEWLSFFVLGLITSLETASGFLSCIGIAIMLSNLKADYTAFAKGKSWVMLGAISAIFVWGIGFMVIAGDWFMAWQAKSNPLSTQLGAMIYMLPCAMTVITLMIHRDK